MDWQDLGNVSLLVIDDDHFTRELISMMLKNVSKVKIDEAGSGEEALLFLENKQHQLDMILLDYYMPGMNGKEFIQRINQQNLSSDTPILLITTDRLSQKELAEVGASYYMTKPFNFATFSSDIYSFIKKSR